MNDERDVRAVGVEKQPIASVTSVTLVSKQIERGYHHLARLCRNKILECGDWSPLSFTKNLSEIDTLFVQENGMEIESGDKSPHSKKRVSTLPS